MSRADLERFLIASGADHAACSALPPPCLDAKGMDGGQWEMESITFDDLPGGTVCQVTVQPVPRTDAIHFDGSVYVRDGNGSRKLEGPALTRWLQERMQR